VSGEAPRYGSDVIVDLLAGQGIRYVALNPGASFRGLHDSLVNRPGAPELLLVPHEKLAVNMAHGYAKASGEPMAALLHDTVGLLHGSLGIFTAFLDRTPVLVLGGAGPMDTARRRPWIDWIHTSSVQAGAVREFTKWDDQPASIEAFGEAFLRARAVALTEPAGTRAPSTGSRSSPSSSGPASSTRTIDSTRRRVTASMSPGAMRSTTRISWSSSTRATRRGRCSRRRHRRARCDHAWPTVAGSSTSGSTSTTCLRGPTTPVRRCRWTCA
jgi:hypothetical protein